MESHSKDQPTRVSLIRLAWTFFITGLTAFGFTALKTLRSVIKKYDWLSDKKLDEGLALVQCYPGPINFDYAAYLGYQLRGVMGAIISTLAFVLPSFTLMIILSHLYFSSGDTEWIPRIFIGLEAIVVGILVDLILDLGKTSLNGIIKIIIAILALIGLISKVDAALIVIASLVLGILFLKNKNPTLNHVKRETSDQPIDKKEWLMISLVFLFIAGFIVFSFAYPDPIKSLNLSLLKMGSIAFGNGLMILPLLRSELVESLGLLTPVEFTDGVVLGQITPGPFMITAAFVGYKVDGLVGAILATIAIYSPSFAMTLVFSNIYNRIKESEIIRAALAGVMAAFIGMLCLTTYQIAQSSIINFSAFLLAAAAFSVIRYLKLNIIWVFSGGLLIWLAVLLLNLV